MRRHAKASVSALAMACCALLAVPAWSQGPTAPAPRRQSMKPRLITA